MCHVLGVTCHLSHVKKKKNNCYKKKKKDFFILKKIGQSGGAGRWRVCHQWGLPHQVYITLALISCSEQGLFF